jgi:hypothetical protein
MLRRVFLLPDVAERSLADQLLGDPSFLDSNRSVICNMQGVVGMLLVIESEVLEKVVAWHGPSWQ